MEISVFWHKPIRLEDGERNNLIYNIANLDRFEEVPGVYMFCRSYNGDISPLYIGKAINLASRIRQQFNTTKLMKAIENSQKGAKVLLVGEINCKPGQGPGKCIGIAEKALIEHALAQGYELINQKGTKTPYDEIEFTGNLAAKRFSRPFIYSRKK
jgi:hypothetical protein